MGKFREFWKKIPFFWINWRNFQKNSIFGKTEGLFFKTQGFANSTWFLLPKNVQKISLVLYKSDWRGSLEQIRKSYELWPLCLRRNCIAIDSLNLLILPDFEVIITLKYQKIFHTQMFCSMFNEKFNVQILHVCTICVHIES